MSRIGKLGIIFILFTSSFTFAQQPPSVPIPTGDQIVLWMRASKVAQNPGLKTALLGNNAIGNYLSTIGVDPSQIDRLTLFMPFNKSWFSGYGISMPQILPKNGAFVVEGSFDSRNNLQGLKSKGWKEMSYANKKVLWWSKGSSYFCDPNGGCAGLLPGGSIVVGGSEAAIKGVLDVAGGKATGIEQNETFQLINQDFAANASRLASIYIQVTPEMRDMIKADTVEIRSSTARSALEYIDYLSETGLSLSNTASGYLLDGYLGMDSESNSLIVASILQIGGGFAPLLPSTNPYRSVLENMSASRQGRIVKLETTMTQQQLLGLIPQYR